MFDKVELFFLIVGHTHASIDQYFSVLANLIIGCDFIGSPLALEYLLAGQEMNYTLSGECLNKASTSAGGTSSHVKPLLAKKISVVYNLKGAFKPLMNNNIKYYSIPHHFKFHKIFGVTAMQYSMYSGQELLPKPPDCLSDFNETDDSLDISFRTLDLVGGEDRLMRECGIDTSSNVSVLSASSKQNINITKVYE